MKRKVFLFSFPLLIALMLSACNNEKDDIIGDINPIRFTVLVTNSDGNDLLDSTRVDNILKNVSISYNGESYPVQHSMYDLFNDTRAVYAPFCGLWVERQLWGPQTSSYKKCVLSIGYFDGEEDTDNREIKLDLGNEQVFSLSYSNKLMRRFDGELNISRDFYLNGKKLKGSDIKYGIFKFQRLPNGQFEYQQ